MSENRCNRCTRRLSDPAAEYGRRCAKIMGYNIKNDGFDRRLLAPYEHAAHTAMDYFDSIKIDYTSPLGMRMLSEYIGKMLQADGIRLVKQSLISSPVDDYPTYTGTVSIKRPDGTMKNYSIYVPELRNSGNIMHLSEKSVVQKEWQWNIPGIIGEFELDDLGYEPFQPFYDNAGNKLSDGTMLEYMPIAQFFYSALKLISDNKTDYFFRITEIQARQGPQMMIEMGFYLPELRNNADRDFNMIAETSSTLTDMRLKQSQFGKAIGAPDQKADIVVSIPEERVSDPYHYYLFKGSDNQWYGYSRRYANEKYYYKIAGKKIPVRDNYVIKLDKTLSAMAEKVLTEYNTKKK